MENTDIIPEKRVKIVMGAFAVVVLFLIYHLAILMSVAPTFLEAKIAHAPNQIYVDPFIPDVLVRYQRPLWGTLVKVIPLE